MSLTQHLSECWRIASQATSTIAASVWDVAEAIRVTSVASDLDLGSAARAARPGHDFVTAIKSGGPIRRRSRHGADWIFLCNTGYSSPRRQWRNVCSGEPIGLDLEDYLAHDWETMCPVAVSAQDPALSASPAVGTFPWAIAQGRPIQRSGAFGAEWFLLGRKIVTSHPRSTSIACLRSVDRGEEYDIRSWDYEATDWVVAGPGLTAADPAAPSATAPSATAATAATASSATVAATTAPAPIQGAASCSMARQAERGCPCDDLSGEGCHRHGIGYPDDPTDPRSNPTPSGSTAGGKPS